VINIGAQHRSSVDDNTDMPHLEWSAFHNWCDRCCETCPMDGTCPVSVADRSMEESLTEACKMLDEICAEEGISLDDLTPPPPPDIDAVLLTDTAKEYGVALHELGLETEGVLVAGKVARVASYLDGHDDFGAWEADAVPNLLLLEKLLADVDAQIASHDGARAPRSSAERLERHGRRLRGLLAPLFEKIPVLSRRILSALVAAGQAPSPFVRVSRRSRKPAPPR
jgi:hypothetical protein